MISPVDLWTLAEAGLGRASGDAAEDAARLLRWQLARVRSLIPRLRRDSRFYAAALAGIDARTLDSPEALRALPFTDPDDVAADLAAFLCIPARDVRRAAVAHTSGSTGAPKRIPFTEGDLRRIVDFFAVGMRHMASPGDHVAILLSGEARDSIGALLREALARLGAAASVCTGAEDAAALADAVRGAACLVGLPATLTRLCRTHPQLRPQSVLLTADYVPEAAVREIERLWRCRAYSHYGMTETGYGCAVQCDARAGHHLRHAEVLVEIVDPATGAPLPPGEEGEVVVTTFAQEALPLLRYRTGDIASLDVAPCPCGGTLPRLGKPRGRKRDALSLGEGTLLSPAALDEILFACGGVLDYRSELLPTPNDKALSTLSVVVDAAPSADLGEIARALRAVYGARLTIRVDARPLPLFPGRTKRRIAVPDDRDGLPSAER